MNTRPPPTAALVIVTAISGPRPGFAADLGMVVPAPVMVPAPVPLTVPKPPGMPAMAARTQALIPRARGIQNLCADQIIGILAKSVSWWHIEGGRLRWRRSRQRLAARDDPAEKNAAEVR